MIEYKKNKVNSDYITVEKIGLFEVLVKDDIENDIVEETQKIVSSLLQYEKENQKLYVKEIEISVDNPLSKAILNGDIDAFNKANNISYKKIINAYNIATFTDNCKMANKILILFKGRIEGDKKHLLEVINENVIDYISENDDYLFYLDKVDGKLNEKRFFVYENEKIERKPLYEKNKVKVLK